MATIDHSRTRRRARLSRGFDYLTLDPSPRLHALRIEMRQRARLSEPWREIRDAVRTALIALVPKGR